MRKTRHSGLVVMLVLLLLASPLTACADKTPAADKALVQKWQAVPIPKLPKRPATIDQKNEKGAVALVDYAMELIPYTMATGETDEWMDICHIDCEFCARFKVLNRLMKEKENWIRGGDIKITNKTVIPSTDLRYDYLIDTEFTRSEAGVYNSSAKTLDVEPATTGTARFAIKYEETQWIIRGAVFKLQNPATGLDGGDQSQTPTQPGEQPAQPQPTQSAPNPQS